MSTNMWSNRETMVAHSYLSKELQKDTRYTPDEIETVFNYSMAHSMADLAVNTDFLDDVIDSFAYRVNWEELSEHHNANVDMQEEADWSEDDNYYVPEHPTWITNMKFSDGTIEALDSYDNEKLWVKTWEDYTSNMKIPEGGLTFIDADNTELLNDLKQSLKDAKEGKTSPLSELWEGLQKYYGEDDIDITGY